MRLLFPGLRFNLIFIKKDLSADLRTIDYQVSPHYQVRMRLDDEDSENDLQLVPGSHGMKVPSACTIVIIAG